MTPLYSHWKERTRAIRRHKTKGTKEIIDALNARNKAEEALFIEVLENDSKDYGYYYDKFKECERRLEALKWKYPKAYDDTAELYLFDEFNDALAKWKEYEND